MTNTQILNSSFLSVVEIVIVVTDQAENVAD